MKREVEFKHGNGVIVVEVDQAAPRGDQLGAVEGTVAKAKQSFEEAASGIRPIAETILGQVSALGPESVSVEFGIKFSAQAGVMLASSAVEGNCKITLSWKPKGSA
jgi:Trypsin-co-occurring domain 1